MALRFGCKPGMVKYGMADSTLNPEHLTPTPAWQLLRAQDGNKYEKTDDRASLSRDVLLFGEQMGA